MKDKHIIWDWNGTLFDDAWLCIDVMNGLLARRDLPALSAGVYEMLFDFPVSDYYRKLGFDFSVDSFERLSDEFIGEYYRRFHECHLREGTREVLEQGRALGFTQSILSAMQQEPLQELVHHCGLGEYFVDIVGLSDHHAAGKVEVAKAWIARQSFQPEQIIFVGDTTHDYEVAQALGVGCIFIHSGHHSRARLSATNAGCLINSLGDLHASLERFPLHRNLNIRT